MIFSKFVKNELIYKAGIKRSFFWFSLFFDSGVIRVKLFSTKIEYSFNTVDYMVRANLHSVALPQRCCKFLSFVLTGRFATNTKKHDNFESFDHVIIHINN